MPGDFLVVLDRDGVLNLQVPRGGGVGPPWHLDQLVVHEAAADAVARLSAAGGMIFVATNQPDVAAGHLDPAELERINAAIVSQAPQISAVLWCPHKQSEGCQCRKPEPGMLREAGRRSGIPADRSWMAGDRWVDVLAGKNAGFHTILIEDERSWLPTSAGAPPADLRPDRTVTSVADVPDLIEEWSKLAEPAEENQGRAGER